MAPIEEAPHPLVGLDECYHLHCKKSITTRLSRWRRWFVRWIYNKWEWTGDMCLEEMGTFTNLEVARAIASQKNQEAIEKKTGDVWEVKPSPINRILPYEQIIYGVREYPGTTLDDHYRARQPTELIDHKTIQQIGNQFAEVDQELNKTLQMVKAASGSS